MPTDDLSPLADRVDAIAAELDEIMFDRLRAAAAARAGRPAADRRLLQARRSLDKAARILRDARTDDKSEGDATGEE